METTYKDVIIEKVNGPVVKPSLNDDLNNEIENFKWTRIGDDIIIYHLEVGASVINVPQGVTIISDRAFDMDYYKELNKKIPPIRKIIIPPSVYKIGKRAFANNNTLEEIEIKGYIINIESETFKGLPNIKRISLPESICFIGHKAFEGTPIKQIYIPRRAKVEDDSFDENTVYLRGPAALEQFLEKDLKQEFNIINTTKKLENKFLKEKEDLIEKYQKEFELHKNQIDIVHNESVNSIKNKIETIKQVYLERKNAWSEAKEVIDYLENGYLNIHEIDLNKPLSHSITLAKMHISDEKQRKKEEQIRIENELKRQKELELLKQKEKEEQEKLFKEEQKRIKEQKKIEDLKNEKLLKLKNEYPQLIFSNEIETHLIGINEIDEKLIIPSFIKSAEFDLFSNLNKTKSVVINGNIKEMFKVLSSIPENYKLDLQINNYNEKISSIFDLSLLTNKVIKLTIKGYSNDNLSKIKYDNKKEKTLKELYVDFKNPLNVFPNVVSLKFPSSIEKLFLNGDFRCGISFETFYETCNLKEILINGDILINKHCYSNCLNLNLIKVNFSSESVSLMQSCFIGCKNLNTIDLENTKRIYIENDAFKNCHNLENVILTKNDKTEVVIQENAFIDCDNIKHIYLHSDINTPLYKIFPSICNPFVLHTNIDLKTLKQKHFGNTLFKKSNFAKNVTIETI